MTVVAKRKPTDWPSTLKALREFYGGITQREAAARIEAPFGTWRNWEQGIRKVNPMMARLIRLSFPEYFAQKS